ncbi:MAG: methyl-accepting chemotaxis protein [Proteobacteria bacterium]|nr:methyl-accepting chemotaxis protein [Pseudomonadota bacterium]
MNILGFIDWFIPDQMRINLTRQSRARIAVSFMFIGGLLMLPNFIRGLRIGRVDIAVVIIVVSLMMMLCPLIMRISGSIIISGNCMLTAYLVVMLYLIVDRGGASSYYATNFITLVVSAFLITGLRNGVFWGVTTLLFLTGLNLAEKNGYQFPEINNEPAYINLMMVLAIVSVIGFIFEWNASNNLRRLAAEKRQQEDAAKTLRDVLDETKLVMGAVAKADLSKRIESDVKGDLVELKESVNEALSMLGDNVLQVLSICDEINNGTTQLSHGAQDLASGATEQAAGIEEMSSSMDEIGGKAKANDDNASQARQLSNQTVNELNKGNAQMDGMLEAMHTINETSSSVAKVIKVIDEIAFQTNLLALNAAVEAARAGKYGKGFAVVAEEVRNLAARSSDAAKDTTELIENSLKQVENGVQSANLTAETLKGFVESINKVNDIVGEISAASKEQTGGVNEISKGLTQVNDVVQKNSSISEESAAASEELSSQTDLLYNLMRRFKLRVEQPAKPKTKTTDKVKQPTKPTTRAADKTEQPAKPKTKTTGKTVQKSAQPRPQPQKSAPTPPKKEPVRILTKQVKVPDKSGPEIEIQKEFGSAPIADKTFQPKLEKPLEPKPATKRRKIVLDDEEFGKY